MRFLGACFAGLVVLILVRNIAAVLTLVWIGYVTVMCALLVGDWLGRAWRTTRRWMT